MSNDRDSNDGVGYGRPPLTTRFKKGASGNPKGRPKGRKNFKTEMREALARPVRVNDGGVTRSLSTQRAIIERLREKALKGDRHAMDQALEMAERLGEEEVATAAEERISENEEEIIADFAQRIREQTLVDLAAAGRLAPLVTPPSAETCGDAAEDGSVSPGTDANGMETKE